MRLSPSWTLRVIGGLTAVAALAAALAAPTSAQVLQAPKNGCSSAQPYSGSLTSPPFSPPSNADSVTFQGWFEVESVNPAAHDQTVLEYSANGGPWTEFGRLFNGPNPGGAADRPFSNRGLGFPPSFQSYSFLLPVGDGPTVQIRFRFDSVDTGYQGFRGVGIDQVLLPEFNAVPEGFEQGAPGWTFDPAGGPGGPSWQILTNPQNVSVKSPEINPTLVTMPDVGALPAAAAGQRVAWFGNAASGTYCGPDFANLPDTAPPDTTTMAGPPAFGRDHTPTFTFTSNEPGSTFACSLDGGPFVPCSSPFTTGRLSPRRHTLAVRATDAAGNADATPFVYDFEIAASLSDLPKPALGRT